MMFRIFKYNYVGNLFNTFVGFFGVKVVRATSQGYYFKGENT